LPGWGLNGQIEVEVDIRVQANLGGKIAQEIGVGGGVKDLIEVALKRGFDLQVAVTASVGEEG
jgi:hypothetical protein